MADGARRAPSGEANGEADAAITLRRAALWYHYDFVGMDRIPGEKGVKDMERNETCRHVLRAVCNAVAADGSASAEEIEWMQGYFSAKGYPEEMIDKIPAMAKECERKTVEEVVSDTKKFVEYGNLRLAARLVVFDAIRASMVDGLDEREMDMIKVIGEAAGVDEATVEELRQLAFEDEAQKVRRIKVLYPEGLPFIAAKYQPES